MSVEALLGPYSQGQSLLEETIKRKTESSQKFSPVDIVANTFADEGRRELLRITGRIRERKLRVDPNSNVSIFQQLPSDLRESARLGFVAVIFGISMLAIKKTVQEKVFSPSQLLMHFNFLVDETFIPKFPKTIMNGVSIPSRRHGEHNRAAQSDPSLSIFFTRAWTLTPELIQKLITDSGSLSIIRATFIPPYKDKVRRLTNHFAMREIK